MARDRTPSDDRPSLAPGEQPYDRLNGMRIGALTGGVFATVIAAVLAATVNPLFVWLIPIGAILGGVAGHRYADRHPPSSGE